MVVKVDQFAIASLPATVVASAVAARPVAGKSDKYSVIGFARWNDRADGSGSSCDDSAERDSPGNIRQYGSRNTHTSVMIPSGDGSLSPGAR